MLLPLILAFQLAAAEPAPTLAQAEGMSPAEAGGLLLRGREHGEIERVERSTSLVMLAPSVTELILFEKPVAAEGGCTRRRWTAAFSGVGGAEPTMYSVSPATEIALTDGKACPPGSYAALSPGIAPEDGFEALSRLITLVGSRSTPVLSCVDQTRSDLCASREETLRELATLEPWAVRRRAQGFEVLLGNRGGPVTIVALPDDANGPIEVERRIPAPA